MSSRYFTPAVLFLTMAFCAAASPIMVGPIGLNGSGTLSKPDFASYGGGGIGGIGMTLHASGTNGVDTVSIDTWDIELYGSSAINSPVAGEYISLTMPNPGSCAIEFLNSFADICGVSIDGVHGYSSFSGLGSGVGLLQVYDSLNPYTKTLLAQAQITNTLIQITDVTYSPANHDRWTANFLVTDPPSDVPEPSTIVLVSGGLLLCFKARSKR